ncbi:unnamed protein product [Diplocarpon coronariae]
MKFAKELEQDLVPEWRMKYLDYTLGKKQVRALSRAQSRMNSSSRTPAPATPAPRKHSLYGATSPITSRDDLLYANRRLDDSTDEPPAVRRSSPLAAAARADPPPPTTTAARAAETGESAVGPPPPARPTATFELPGPAPARPPLGDGTRSPRKIPDRPAPGRVAPVSIPDNAHQFRRTMTSPIRTTFESHREQVPPHVSARPFVRRMFSMRRTPTELSTTHRADADAVAIDQVKTRQRLFLAFLDRELDKVEAFYRSKEDETGQRLRVLREQLHEMRNRRVDEVARAQRAKKLRRPEGGGVPDSPGRKPSGDPVKEEDDDDDDDYCPTSADRLTAWLDPLGRAYGNAKAKITGPGGGTNTEAMQKMAAAAPDSRDWVRRPRYGNEVPYRTAKRKLKLALQEHYRGMELLKSYALLNRTAFRKLNKKYDKAVGAHPPLRFMSEKVNRAWFVQSDVLEAHINAVEELYAQYFERGNRKIASGKLRGITKRKADQSGSAFRNGILIGTGTVFSVQGIINGIRLLKGPDPVIRIQTSYLLQIYGGYFLALYLFSWFCLSCKIWTQNKINYQFVFEFDPRHNLDWRQLSQFPSFLILLLGIFVWLNFSNYSSPAMFLYYPVILIALTVVIILFPGPYMFHRSRRWFAYSHWRLLLAGFYPVQFRDFFLGDMYCSLTYLTGNIALFFCLYGSAWNTPGRCNSSHSRLLGFFTALPGIWRVLQCLRRYFDTRNAFPHMVNGAKYTMTIAYCVTLSVYRIDHTRKTLIIFITFATVSSIFSAIWDLLMDWSLLQPNASKRWLRDVRGFPSPTFYYVAMVLDPIFRFNWILYVFYTHNLQSSTLVSFLVALSEVTRRGIWILIRVENEHCSNVAHFKASRDVPLPYAVPSDAEDEMGRADGPPAPEARPTLGPAPGPGQPPQRSYTSATLESQQSVGSSFRYRSGLPRGFTAMVANAHTQDFEKKWKPRAEDGEGAAGRCRAGDEEDRRPSEDKSSHDGDEDDAADLKEAEAALRHSPWPATFK